MLEEALTKFLREDNAIKEKIKDGNIYHIYPLRLPPGVNLRNGYAITYTEISQLLTYPLLRKSSFQLNIFGNSFEKARNLSNDVFNALNDLSEIKLGNIFTVNYIKFENRRAFYDDSPKLWYFVLEISIKY